MQQKNGILKGSYKVQGGKLLKCEIEIENDTLKRMKLTGDFFMYPEDKIDEFEHYMCNTKITQIHEKIKDFFCKDIELIGATPDDISYLVMNTINIHTEK